MHLQLNIKYHSNTFCCKNIYVKTQSVPADYAKQLGVPQVIRVSGSSYVVCGIPDTSATTGFVHVKSHNHTLLCSVKNCRIFSGGKQLKTRHVCLHVHLLSCSLGLWKVPSPAIASSTTRTSN